MLMNYRFKNYKSYLEECNFSMLANADKSHECNLEKFGKERVSKVKIIYGANASGKTSFIDSINFLRKFALDSNHLVEGNHVHIVPYKFRTKYLDYPSDFSITFIKNDIKYTYSFSCTHERVIDEKLDIYYSSKPSNIFTRTNTNDYKFNTDIRLLNEIKTKNTSNKLFLITAATWNYEKVKPVVDFIMNDIVVLYSTSHNTKYDLNYITRHNDLEDYKEFCLDFLNSADISINDIIVDTKKLKDIEDDITTIKNIINIVFGDNLKNGEKIEDVDVFNIRTKHNIENNSYLLELNEESMGTKQLFYLAPVLYYVFKEGKTLFVDEIDKSLHPNLVEYIIKKFNNKEINKHNAQLICNTHDTNLLNLNLFRRDEILFTDRNNKNGTSEMYALSDFSPRKDENIEKAYLLGRFGAVPFIKED